MTLPLVSIVIPAYNAADWIEECLDSVLMQDYPNKEIIVVDDASTDETTTLVAWYEQRHKEVTLIMRVPNQGEYATSRKGFEVAKGDFICRLSADDKWIGKEHLSQQVEEMVDGADWCYNATNFSGRSGRIPDTVRSMWMPVPNRFVSPAFQKFDDWFLSHPLIAFLIAVRRNPVNSSTLMVRKSAYTELKYFGDWRTDWDSQVIFWLLLNQKRGKAIQDYIGVFYRLHAGQASHHSSYQRDMKEVRKCVLAVVDAGDYPAWLKLMSKVMRVWISRKY